VVDEERRQKTLRASARIRELEEEKEGLMARAAALTEEKEGLAARVHALEEEAKDHEEKFAALQRKAIERIKEGQAALEEQREETEKLRVDLEEQREEAEKLRTDLEEQRARPIEHEVPPPLPPGPAEDFGPAPGFDDFGGDDDVPPPPSEDDRSLRRRPRDRLDDDDELPPRRRQRIESPPPSPILPPAVRRREREVDAPVCSWATSYGGMPKAKPCAGPINLFSKRDYSTVYLCGAHTCSKRGKDCLIITRHPQGRKCDRCSRTKAGKQRQKQYFADRSRAKRQQDPDSSSSEEDA
jgi:hypothetical protein